jgi:hypothetical protein
MFRYLRVTLLGREPPIRIRRARKAFQYHPTGALLTRFQGRLRRSGIDRIRNPFQLYSKHVGSASTVSGGFGRIGFGAVAPGSRFFIWIQAVVSASHCGKPLCTPTSENDRQGRLGKSEPGSLHPGNSPFEHRSQRGLAAE